MHTAGKQKQQYQQSDPGNRAFPQQFQIICYVPVVKQSNHTKHEKHCKQFLLIAIPELPPLSAFLCLFRIYHLLAQLVTGIIQQTACQDDILGASGQLAQYRDLSAGGLVDQCQRRFASLNVLADVSQFQNIALGDLLIVCLVDKGQRQNAGIDTTGTGDYLCGKIQSTAGCTAAESDKWKYIKKE